MAQDTGKARNILVTGATDGIGFLLAKSYASRGHRVLATGRQTLSDDAAYFGLPNITYVTADQAFPAQAAHAVDAAMERLGFEGLDLAILNAGVGWTGDPAAEPAEQIATQIDVNLSAPVMISATIAPLLFARQGQLVLIGSTAAKGQARFATYAATKAGLAGFARSLREEWQGRAHVQIIHPGPTRTAMHTKAGLNLGLARMMFMSPKRASKAIQKSVRNHERQRKLSWFYGLRALFSRAGEGRL